MNLMGGLSTTRILNLVMNTLYERFVENDVKEFDGFSVGILNTFNTINMAIPGKHYVAPSHKDVKDLFERWEKANKEQKKKIFSDFINNNVNLNKVDESMIITAIVAPPAAMVAKRKGRLVPQLTFLNVIPDVVFVPSATIFALFAIKILRLMFMGKTTSKDETEPLMQPAPTTKQDYQSTSEQESQITTTPPTEPAPAIEQEPQSPPAEPEPEPEIKHEPRHTHQAKTFCNMLITKGKKHGLMPNAIALKIQCHNIKNEA